VAELQLEVILGLLSW